MKPTALKKGDVVNIAEYDGCVRRAEFVRRQAPPLGLRNGDCYFIVPEFAGMDGPQDIGEIVMKDTDVRRQVERVA
jgi:hypothetical protein